MAGTKSLASRSPTPFEFHGSDASNSTPFTVEIPRFETEHMDADGDLVLEVPYMDENEQPLTKKFVACSKTLSRSSPVFKKMLFGGFAESKQPEKGGEPWTVNLPDDDHDALKVLLDIVHSNFDKVPNSVTDLDDLYHIAVLTDKYDMTHLLRPWIRQWESPKYEEMPLWDDSRGKSQDCFLEKHLWIAWQFGAQRRLYRLVRDLAQYSCLDENGTLASKEDDGSVVLRFKDTLTPPGLYGQ
ncbi:hypothetical protein MGN70_004408 [Eutypa lata]|nr:hypothetical protein MGN70_004408 [Eutypa lata]